MDGASFIECHFVRNNSTVHYQKKADTAMVNKSVNINDQIIKHQRDIYKWRWRSMFWLGTGTQMFAGL